MDADEREIYDYIKAWKQDFVSTLEICRRAGGKRKFRRFEHWAIPAITRMLERGILETDNSARYRLKPPPPNDKRRRWVSPSIGQILAESDKNFSGTIMLDDETDQYYERL